LSVMLTFAAVLAAAAWSAADSAAAAAADPSAAAVAAGVGPAVGRAAGSAPARPGSPRRYCPPAQRDQTGQQCHGREHAADIRPPNTQNGSVGGRRKPVAGVADPGPASARPATLFSKSPFGFHIALVSQEIIDQSIDGLHSGRETGSRCFRLWPASHGARCGSEYGSGSHRDASCAASPQRRPQRISVKDARDGVCAHRASASPVRSASRQGRNISHRRSALTDAVDPERATINQAERHGDNDLPAGRPGDNHQTSASAFNKAQPPSTSNHYLLEELDRKFLHARKFR